LPEIDQAAHVVVDASEIRGGHGGLRGRCRDMDVGREALAGRVKVVIAPRLCVRKGNPNGR
jgi:hypothetical protein